MKTCLTKDFLDGPIINTCTPSAGGLGLIPGQGTRSPRPQLKTTACGGAKSLQSCPTLCDLMDCSQPGLSAHGILQARRLEWMAVSSSRGSSQPRGRTCVSYISCIVRGWRGEFLPLVPPGKPKDLLQPSKKTKFFLRKITLSFN